MQEDVSPSEQLLLQLLPGVQNIESHTQVSLVSCSAFRQTEHRWLLAQSRFRFLHNVPNSPDDSSSGLSDLHPEPLAAWWTVSLLGHKFTPQQSDYRRRHCSLPTLKLCAGTQPSSWESVVCHLALHLSLCSTCVRSHSSFCKLETKHRKSAADNKSVVSLFLMQVIIHWPPADSPAAYFLPGDDVLKRLRRPRGQLGSLNALVAAATGQCLLLGLERFARPESPSGTEVSGVFKAPTLLLLTLTFCSVLIIQRFLHVIVVILH